MLPRAPNYAYDVWITFTHLHNGLFLLFRPLTPSQRVRVSYKTTPSFFPKY